MFICVIITRCLDYLFFFLLLPQTQVSTWGSSKAASRLAWWRPASHVDRISPAESRILAIYFMAVQFTVTLEQTIKWMPQPLWSGLYASYIPRQMEPRWAKWAIGCHKVISYIQMYTKEHTHLVIYEVLWVSFQFFCHRMTVLNWWRGHIAAVVIFFLLMCMKCLLSLIPFLQ